MKRKKLSFLEEDGTIKYLEYNEDKNNTKKINVAVILAVIIVIIGFSALTFF